MGHVDDTAGDRNRGQEGVGARGARSHRFLGLLLLVNLLNYIDRQALYALFPLIKNDLQLTDAELGMLGSVFMISYMFSAPLIGWWSDRVSRARLAAGGLVAWSLATAAAGLTSGYRPLVAFRALVGVGEASFGAVSPGLLSDYYDRQQRGRILTIFYLAIPVGSALGYLLGGVVGHAYGWHAALLCVGLPGLLLAIPLWRWQDRSSVQAAVREHASLARFSALARNRPFLITTLAMAAMTFAMGGLAQWMPTFLFRQYALDTAKANTLFGGITVAAGLLGTLLGGWIAERIQRRRRHGYQIVSGVGFLIGAPLIAAALLAQSLGWSLAAIFSAEFFLFLNTGPLNTVIANAVRSDARAAAFAVNIFAIHALGDAISPSIIGWLSDRYGIVSALLITPMASLVAALFCFVFVTSKDSANAS